MKLRQGRADKLLRQLAAGTIRRKEAVDDWMIEKVPLLELR